MKELIRMNDVTLVLPNGERVIDQFSLSGKAKENIFIYSPIGIHIPFLDVITGLKKPSHGSVEINGRLAVVSCSSSFIAEMPTIFSMILPLIMAGMSEEAAVDIICGLAKQVGIGHCIYSRPVFLSSTEKYIATLLSAFSGDPDILLLENPANCYSEASRGRIFSTIRKLRNDKALIIFLSSNTPTDEFNWTQQLSALGGNKSATYF